MNIASKTLQEQKKRYLYVVIQGLAITGISIFIGIKLITEGLGKPSSESRGKAAVFTKFMKAILGDRDDLDQIMAYCLAGLVFIAAAWGVYYCIKGLYHMASSHTVLGKSLLLQAKSYEKLPDLIEAVDTDMNQGSQKFGKVFVGREWILEAQAMRLARMRGIFTINEGEFDFILCCVDDEFNMWAASFTYADEREKAMKYISARYPDLVFGDKNACMEFIKRTDKQLD